MLQRSCRPEQVGTPYCPGSQCAVSGTIMWTSGTGPWVRNRGNRMIAEPLPRTRHAVPSTVWALGFVSMFMDVSSEMIHALLPVFLVSTLGASAIFVGVIEGIGEGATAITKVFSGA